MSDVNIYLSRLSDPVLRELLKGLTEPPIATSSARRRLEGFSDWLSARNLQNEAADVLEFCDAAFPRQDGSLLEYAEHAIAEKNWLEAAGAYKAIREQFPKDTVGFVYGGWALWETEQFDEADSVLTEGMRRFPDDFWLKFHYAYSARRKQDWPEAARRFEHLRCSHPDSPIGYTEGGWALREAGRLADADDVLREATEKFPDDRTGWVHYGRNATALNKSAEAVRRWERCSNLFPDETFWRVELEQARYEHAFAEMGRSNTAELTTVFGEGGPQSLLMKFESIGDNCEFGLAQRHFGAEPLGLLRFGEVPSLEFLLETLENRFEGVGEAANISGHIGHGGEHFILSTKGFRMMHCHVWESETTPLASTVASMIPRIQYLRRRLLESLLEASKIWIYKRFDPISDTEVVALENALMKYNSNNKLLCVRRPNDIFVEGEVTKFGERVVIGYVDFRRVLDPHNDSPVHVDAYLKVCTEAYSLLAEGNS